MRPRPGLTLVELVMVLTIAGLLLATALPRLDHVRDSVTVEGAAQQFARDLAEARSLAVRNNRTVRVVRLDLATYRVDTLSIRALADGVQFDATSAAMVEYASFGPAASGGAVFTMQKGRGRKRVEVTPSGKARVKK